MHEQQGRRPVIRYRLNRKGAVIEDRRELGATVGTNDYEHGDALFVVGKSSPARIAYKAKRVAARLAKRNAGKTAAAAIHSAAQR